MVRTFCCWLAFGAMGLALASPAPGADAAKINVLIIDGQNNHNWKGTTPPIKAMLEKTGRFTVDVLTSLPKPDPKKATDDEKKAAAEGWARFRHDFSKYQVVFSNYNGEPWPEEVNKAFEKYMENGGGLVVFHAANNAFTKWEAWAKRVALLWQGPATGDRLYVDDAGKVVRQKKGEGPGAGHGPQWAYTLQVRDKDHPITKGLPEKWVHAQDELYQAMRGPAENVHILVTAWADPAQKGTGGHEPMAFTVTCGKGRVFVNLLGHDATSVTHPGCAALMVRGTEWAATGAVTIPPPADLK
jgi:type 1 glutamine amidotransferase